MPARGVLDSECWAFGGWMDGGGLLVRGGGGRGCGHGSVEEVVVVLVVVVPCWRLVTGGK